MLIPKDYYEMTNEVSPSELEGVESCEICKRKLSHFSSVVILEGYNEVFCSYYPCFDRWTIDEYSANCDHIYEQYKEQKRGNK